MQKLLQTEAKQSVQKGSRWTAVAAATRKRTPGLVGVMPEAGLRRDRDPLQNKRALTHSFHDDLTTWLPGSHFGPLVPS